MQRYRFAGFPVWFWSAAAAGSLLLAVIVLQPWCDPQLLVDDAPQIADELLETQYHHPAAGPLRFPWLGGLLTQLGALLLCAAGAVAWTVTGIFAGEGTRSPLRRFLIWSGLLSLVLGLDELLMFHEKAHDQFGPSFAKLFTMSYAFALLWLLWRHRKAMWATEWKVLLAALVCFGLSEFLANLGMLNRTRFLHLRIWSPSPARTLCEEGLKWLGCVVWFAYFTHSARLEIVRVLSQRRENEDPSLPLA